MHIGSHRGLGREEGIERLVAGMRARSDARRDAADAEQRRRGCRCSCSRTRPAPATASARRSRTWPTSRRGGRARACRWTASASASTRPTCGAPATTSPTEAGVDELVGRIDEMLGREQRRHAPSERLAHDGRLAPRSPRAHRRRPDRRRRHAQSCSTHPWLATLPTYPRDARHGHRLRQGQPRSGAACSSTARRLPHACRRRRSQLRGSRTRTCAPELTLTRSCARGPYQGPISSNGRAPEYADVAHQAADVGGQPSLGQRRIQDPMSVQNGRAFNEWLRTQLKAKKMSQRQLAQQSGVDHSTISRLVRGDRTPSLGTATKLARGLRELRDETETPHYFGLVAVVDQPPDRPRRVRAALGRSAERAAGSPGDGVLPRAAHAPPRGCAPERPGRLRPGHRGPCRARSADAEPQLDRPDRRHDCRLAPRPDECRSHRPAFSFLGSDAVDGRLIA